MSLKDDISYSKVALTLHLNEMMKLIQDDINWHVIWSGMLKEFPLEKPDGFESHFEIHFDFFKNSAVLWFSDKILIGKVET